MGITVCEFSFEHPDPKDSSIALHEIDFYAWIPHKFQKTTPNHRLSLRFRFSSKNFEVYRRFSQPVRFVDSERNLLIDTSKDTGLEQTIFDSKSLGESLAFANGEYVKFHGRRHEDKVCLHKYPQQASFCGKEDK
jgi:hypothetical protein